MRFIIRTGVVWVIQAIILLIMANLQPGVEVEGAGTALLAVAVIALLNALLWPLLSYLILPFAVLTLGLASLVLNGVLILLATILIEGFSVDTLGTAMLLALGMTALNIVISSLLTIDDDSTWYRNALRRRMKQRKQIVETDEPGFLFIEIDGLAEPVLEYAMEQGYLPTLSRWLQSGSHRLIGWETDLSSQTSASQAGILQGNNHNIPAFRWYDRARREIVSSSDPRFVAELEKRLSNGDGLLANNGASRGNLFSGDAPNVMNTASTILDRTRFHTADFYAFFLYPYNFARTLILTIWDIILEKWQFYKARRNGVYPILDKAHRGGTYPLLRAFTTVLMRELNIHTLIGDVFSGIPAVYATFVGYDEVAHHSGVLSEDALDVLKKLDIQIGRLEKAVAQAPRPYHLVVLSDHGQTGGATFQQRYGQSLEDLVQELLGETAVIQVGADVHEDWKDLNVFLTETMHYDQQTLSKALSKLLQRRTQKGQVALGPEGGQDGDGSRGGKESLDVIVLASGNLGLVYGSHAERRLTMEQIETLFPGLLEGLARHEGIGFVMAHSAEHGPVAIGAEGRVYLQDGRVEGENPLTPFGSQAAQHLLRYDGFPDAPDLYINSFYDPETGEGAAFEEQIGFHGGMGGPQTRPFVLYPKDLPPAEEPLIGPEAVYHLFRSWQRSAVD